MQPKQDKHNWGLTLIAYFCDMAKELNQTFFKAAFYIKLGLLILIFSCSENSVNGQTGIGQRQQIIDQKKYVIEANLKNVRIDGKFFTIFVTHDRYDEHHRLYSKYEEGEVAFTKLTITIVDERNNAVIYSGIQKENEFKIVKSGNRKLSDPGKLFLELSASYGGSGFSGDLFMVYLDGNKISLIPVFPYSTLSYIVFSNDDNEILLMNGIWDSNPKEPHEAHFANHRYDLLKYTCQDKNFVENNLGRTIYKYSSLDANEDQNEILHDIMSKEPNLTRALDIRNYDRK